MVLPLVPWYTHASHAPASHALALPDRATQPACSREAGQIEARCLDALALSASADAPAPMDEDAPIFTPRTMAGKGYGAAVASGGSPGDDAPIFTPRTMARKSAVDAEVVAQQAALEKGAPLGKQLAEASFQMLLRDIMKEHGEHPNFGLVKVVCDKSPNEGVEWVHPDCVEALREKGLSLLRPKK